MELRYVYVRVEDAIGAPLHIAESPHAPLTRRLRHDLCELRSLAHRSEVLALCLAPMCGSPNIDIDKLYDSVSRLLDTATGRRLPYVKSSMSTRKKEPAAYDKYFRQLEEFKKSLAADKSAGGGREGPGTPSPEEAGAGHRGT